jgi:hypothetical protein
MDPDARRLLRTQVANYTKGGRAVVLTSHTIEDCKVGTRAAPRAAPRAAHVLLHVLPTCCPTCYLSQTFSRPDAILGFKARVAFWLAL